MKIKSGLELFELSGQAEMVIHPTLVWDNDNVILIDSGLPGMLQAFQDAIERTGVVFSKLNKIILTHHHRDHIGSLSNLLEAVDHKIEVLAHQAEKPYIEGNRQLEPEIIRQMLEALPDKQRLQIEHPQAVHVGTTLEDGQELPFCGGIVVIHTPGHTPGHICLYLKQYKVLIPGDELIVDDGQLLGPRPEFTPELSEAIKSLDKLMQYDIETIMCYHGGLYRGNIRQRIAELAMRHS
ncbi:MAG: MBL fold metallo-hydrolase [Clostridiaceae bacterium]|nr:MBL fold metallo-hydrolase [Clostridiaceae bacterium]